MVTDQKPGQMVLNMKDDTYRVKNMVLVDLHGLMVLHIMVNSQKTIFKVRENTIGQTGENMMGYG